MGKEGGEGKEGGGKGSHSPHSRFPPWHPQWLHRPLIAYAVTDLLAGAIATPLAMRLQGFRRLGSALAGAWDSEGARGGAVVGTSTNS